jgi:hypothetical protein
MSDEEIRSSHLHRRRPVHATRGVLDETGQEPDVVEAEQAGSVTNGYAWSGRMRATGDVVETMIPRRLDRLPWSRWHWLVVTGLGITWILDGFEVTLVGAIASMLTHKDALGLTTRQAASAGTFYLVGAIAGAFVFGYLTDRFGRTTASPRPGSCPRRTTSRPAMPESAPSTTSSGRRRRRCTDSRGQRGAPSSSTTTTRRRRRSGTTTTRSG